jgi:hypothetical protein
LMFGMEHKFHHLILRPHLAIQDPMLKIKIT